MGESLDTALSIYIDQLIEDAKEYREYAARPGLTAAYRMQRNKEADALSRVAYDLTQIRDRIRKQEGNTP